MVCKIPFLNPLFQGLKKPENILLKADEFVMSNSNSKMYSIHLNRCKHNY